MIDRVEETFDLKPDRLLGDTAYGSADMLHWLVEEKRIEPHIPVWDKSNRNTDIFNRSDFAWDAKADHYTCPLKHQCCPNTTFKKIARSIHEASRDVARAIGRTPEYLQSRKDRKKVEVLFAHLKRILKLDRLRLRGLSGAGDEFLMAATVQNLKKLANLRYKPPDHRIGVSA